MVKTSTWFPDDTKKSFNNQRPQQNRPPQGRPQDKPHKREEPKEPDVFLKGSKVRIHWLAGGRQPLEGILSHVSKFQLVLEINGKGITIYKHAVEYLEPIDG